MLNPQSDVRNVQYLRAVAAISVVIFHVSETYDLHFKIGAAGVDIFFVISGFIMWVTTQGKVVNPQTFMSRRISRVVPLYWIVTLVTYVAVAIKPHFFFDINASDKNFLASLFFLPAIKDGALHPVVVQGWTLSYEMMFYLIFSLTLLLEETRRFYALLLVFAAMAVAHYHLTAGHLSTFTDPIILEFAAGVAIGRLWTQGVRVPFGLAVGFVVVGILLLIASYWALHLDRVVRWGIPSALLLLGAVFVEKERGSPKLDFLHFLGDASYSIYIWHVLIGVLMTALLLRIGLTGPALPLALMVSSLALSLICYLLVERPMLRRLRASRRRPAME